MVFSLLYNRDLEPFMQLLYVKSEQHPDGKVTEHDMGDPLFRSRRALVADNPAEDTPDLHFGGIGF